ncbi:MAG TPA: Ig-like domain-containing protein [Gammaproteobacteria bacterium]|jgi:hypothetical protein|nr:Ig-like domain-containing protein [Gammaproteobacteria bacterium]
MKALCSGSLKVFSRLFTAVLLLGAAGLAHAASQAPGGFLESDETTAVRTQLSPASIAGFVPSRGGFEFPAPYNTHGVRVTNESDCGGQDCVDMIYSYWRNMSNSAGSDTMYVFIGLDQARGGKGPTLFKYVKSTDTLSKVGPLFDSSSKYARQSGEGWYFSYSMPTKIYMQDKSKLLRYDVLKHSFETVFDSTTKYPNTIITQTNTSNDDDVHSATLEDATTYAKKGCIVYTASSKKFEFYAGDKMDECQIDKGGRYLVLKEKLASDPCTTCDVDNVIVDRATGTQRTIMDTAGAGGHSDMGYGYYVASDNHDVNPNAWKLWDLTQGTLKGQLVYHGGSWGDFTPSHVSFANAVEGKPIAQQYVCGGATTASPDARSNDIVCFTLDASTPTSAEQALVIAPVMSDLNAVGGDATCPSCNAYGKDPKGNLDPTGQYFFWVSNMGGDRMDAFMVKVPYQLLTGAGADESVEITSPSDGSPVSGSFTVTVTVADASAIAGVTIQVDGQDDTTATAAPYKATFDASALAAGTHTITATATDTQGNTVSAAPVTITVGKAGSAGGTGGLNAGAGGGGGGGGGAMSLLGLLLLGAVRKFRSNRKGE